MEDRQNRFLFRLKLRNCCKVHHSRFAFGNRRRVAGREPKTIVLEKNDSSLSYSIPRARI